MTVQTPPRSVAVLSEPRVAPGGVIEMAAGSAPRPLETSELISAAPIPDLFGNPCRQGLGRPKGRKPYVATDERRTLVISLRRDGWSQNAIAEKLGLSPTTFLRFYDREAGVRAAGTARGRLPHAPTAETRRIVTEMRSRSVSRHEVARALGISVPTLRRHYQSELA